MSKRTFKKNLPLLKTKLGLRFTEWLDPDQHYIRCRIRIRNPGFISTAVMHCTTNSYLDNHLNNHIKTTYA